MHSSKSRQIEGALAFPDGEQQPGLHDGLAGVWRQLEVVGTGHHAGQVTVHRAVQPTVGPAQKSPIRQVDSLRIYRMITCMAQVMTLSMPSRYCRLGGRGGGRCSMAHLEPSKPIGNPGEVASSCLFG